MSTPLPTIGIRYARGTSTVTFYYGGEQVAERIYRTVARHVMLCEADCWCDGREWDGQPVKITRFWERVAR